ncbi:MAG: terpene cyclase/mutase family protein [Planctomycetes bacterium]|nr:terpene cyclase/mutase family protein [Planctomycetota bacterium]
MMRAGIVVGVLAAMVGQAWAPSRADEPAAVAASERRAPPRPAAAERLSPAELDGAIDRGRRFLVAVQNDDGSFGTPERTKDLNIMAGVGSHHGFRAATTALCVQALIEEHDGSPEVLRAIERGEEWLMDELPKVRRDDPMLIYNVWSHGYGIQALVAMHGRLPDDAQRRERIAGLIRGQFEKLVRYESAEGGWGYYDFTAGTQRPASSSTSFVNAMVLIALADARAIGIEPPARITQRALESTRKQRLPDYSYLYGSYLRMEPRMGINRPAGSLGRSQACNLAFRLWGDQTITDGVLAEWLDRLIQRNGWLDLGRKRPVPHESFFQVAGYFYYFGHYYAARVIDILPAAERPFYQDHLARILLAVQDADGSWWDYPLYNYHQQYGTAYALMSLHRCRRANDALPVPDQR